MKKIITFSLIFLSLNLYSQIESATDFLNLGRSSAKVKHSKLGSFNGWKGIGVNQSKIDGNMTSFMYYSKFYKGDKYFIMLKTILHSNTYTYTHITHLTVNNEKLFYSWMKEWKSSGISFVKDLNGEEKWVTMDEDYFIIYMEKRKIKDIWVYEISILIE